MADLKDAGEKPERLEAQVKAFDMSEDMRDEAIEVAREAMEKENIEKVSFTAIDGESFQSLKFLKEIAKHIKVEFDHRKGATWHCIVGRNFGSFVTHETNHFIYFYLGHYAILLFKTQ